MKLVVQILGWVELAFGLIAGVALIIDANNGQTGDGAGIVLAIAMIGQAIVTLVFVNSLKEQV